MAGHVHSRLCQGRSPLALPELERYTLARIGREALCIQFSRSRPLVAKYKASKETARYERIRASERSASKYRHVLCRTGRSIAIRNDHDVNPQQRVRWAEVVGTEDPGLLGVR